MTGDGSETTDGVQSGRTAARGLPAKGGPSATKRAPAKPAPAPAADDDENGDGDGDGDEISEPTGFVDAGKNLGSTVRAEAGKRGAGLANTATGLVRTTSGTLGYLGTLVREQMGNVHKIAAAKFGLLSSLGNGLTGGAINVMQSAQEVGTEGAKALKNVLGSTTKFGKATTKVGGSVLKAPFDIGTEVFGVGNRIARVPTVLTKKASSKAKDALSTMGVDSEEADGEAGDDEEPEEEAPPKPAPKAKKPAAKK